MKKLILKLLLLTALLFIGYGNYKTLVISAEITVNPTPDEFAVYLSKNTYKLNELNNPNDIQLEVKPIISIDDVITYYWNKNILKVKRIALRDNLDKNEITTDKCFVVVAKGQRICFGVFRSVMYSYVPPYPNIDIENFYGIYSDSVWERDNIKCDKDEWLIMIYGDLSKMKDQRVYSVLKSHNKLIENP